MYLSDRFTDMGVGINANKKINQKLNGEKMTLTDHQYKIQYNYVTDNLATDTQKQITTIEDINKRIIVKFPQ